jgi:hypothetical protein
MCSKPFSGFSGSNLPLYHTPRFWNSISLHTYYHHTAEIRLHAAAVLGISIQIFGSIFKGYRRKVKATSKARCSTWCVCYPCDFIEYSDCLFSDLRTGPTLDWTYQAPIPALETHLLSRHPSKLQSFNAASISLSNANLILEDNRERAPHNISPSRVNDETIHLQ